MKFSELKEGTEFKIPSEEQVFLTAQAIVFRKKRTSASNAVLEIFGQTVNIKVPENEEVEEVK